MKTNVDIAALAVICSLLPLRAFALAPQAATSASGEVPSRVGYVSLKVKPSVVDPEISAFDFEHRITYAPAKKDSKILLFLTGTTQTPGPGPRHLFDTALAQGYRVMSLVYISFPAVSQVCSPRSALLAKDPACAAHFRQRRIYGDIDFPAIPDRPQDAIVPRLTRLLAHLVRTDPTGGWERYLRDGKPVWSEFAIVGQSQGGGMAEFLGKRETLDRVISFSGGWDYGAPSRQLAQWYSEPAATPPERWFGVYHVKEPFATDLLLSYQALGIPDRHIFALDQPLSEAEQRGKMPGHGIGVRNPAYRSVWLTMLGSGESDQE